MCKIVVCVPTYKRIDLIKEFLETQVEIYKKYNIDIWIYDSNETNECQELVNIYKKIYDNIFYISIPSSTHSNQKVMRIYEGYDRNKDYDYVWLSQDAYRITDNELCDIVNKVKKQYDIITISNDDNMCIGNKEYFNILEYFRDTAWKLTGYGNCIVKTSTMINDVDWKYIEDKYLAKDCINYSHVGYYFEQLLKINNPKMYFKHVNDGEYYWSELKKHSAWVKDTFHIICDVWPALVNKIPSYYDTYKNDVIKSLGVNASILTYRKFIYLRKSDIYNKYIYEHYKGLWNQFCDVDESFLSRLANVLPCEVISLEQERVLNFCKNYKYIYIYGCGKISKEVVDILKSINIGWKAFFISGKSEQSCLDNHKILKFDKMLLNENVGIIMGLSYKNYNEVIKKYNLYDYQEQLLKMY